MLVVLPTNAVIDWLSAPATDLTITKCIYFSCDPVFATEQDSPMNKFDITRAIFLLISHQTNVKQEVVTHWRPQTIKRTDRATGVRRNKQMVVLYGTERYHADD